MKEDSVVFLKRIQKQCPIVLSLLDSKQVKLISRSHSETYDLKDVNDEYLNDVRCGINIRHRIEDAEQSLRQTLLIPRMVDKEVDVKNFEKQIEVLKMVSRQNSYDKSDGTAPLGQTKFDFTFHGFFPFKQ